MDALVAWLDHAGSLAFSAGIGTLVLLDLAAVAVIAVRRDRALVNRWTGRLLAANLALLGVGLGGPAVAFAGRTLAGAVGLLVPSGGATLTADEGPRDR